VIMLRVGIGQDSHRFDFENKNKKLVLGGVIFEEGPALAANSDGDVVLHALTNAISGVTGVNILGPVADDMCLNKGITDSSAYLREALKYLEGAAIRHVSISIEAKVPRITPMIPAMKNSISSLLGIDPASVCITATTGEGLTDFGKGLGIQVFCAITVE